MSSKRNYIEIEKTNWSGLLVGILGMVGGFGLWLYTAFAILDGADKFICLVLSASILGFIAIVVGLILVSNCKYDEKFYVEKEE